MIVFDNITIRSALPLADQRSTPDAGALGLQVSNYSNREFTIQVMPDGIETIIPAYSLVTLPVNNAAVGQTIIKDLGISTAAAQSYMALSLIYLKEKTNAEVKTLADIPRYVQNLIVAFLQGVDITLGGLLNQEGILRVLDAAGVLGIDLKNDGMRFYDNAGNLALLFNTTRQNKTITVGAAGSGKDFTSIMAAWNTIPYLVVHNVTIEVDAGDYNEDLILDNRQGSGFVFIKGIGGEARVKTLTATDLYLQLFLSDITATTSTTNAFSLHRNKIVSMVNCKATAAAGGALRGLYCGQGEYSIQNCEFSNKPVAVYGSNGAHVLAIGLLGTGNTKAYVANYGTVEIFGGSIAGAWDSTAGIIIPHAVGGGQTQIMGQTLWDGKNLQIKTGHVTGLTTASWTYVPYGMTFTSAPRVVATFSKDASGDWHHVKTRNVTTTGFEITIGGSSVSGIEADWIAILI